MTTQDVLALLEKNDLPAALIKCQEIVSNHPQNADAQHLLGLLYAKHGDITSAITHFKLAINLDPKQAIYHNNLSNAYKLNHNLELAICHLNEALRIAPNNAESFNNLGSLYYTQRDIKRAILQFEKAIRLNPASWEAHYNLANCYIKQDMVLQAISHYETTLKLNPNHRDARLNLAMSYIITNDYAAALPLLIEAANNNPQHAELQGHLAEAYLNLGQTENALQQYIKAIALEANRPAWQHNLAVLYLRSNKPDLAQQHFALALQLQPDNITAQHMLNALTASAASKTAPPEYVKLLFDQYASYYNQHVTKALNYTVPQKLRQAIGKFITNTTKQQYILDLGCGTGLCGIYFRDLARYLLGIDLSITMLHEANKLGAYDALCCCNILEYIPGLNKNCFEMILAADVFVYIGDLEAIFLQATSIIQTHGLFAFTIEEQTSNTPYTLQATGRYAHAPEYINTLCVTHGFTIETNEPITPRMHDNQPIAGRLYVVKKSTEQ